MARAMGSRPVALSSGPEKEEFARSLGAEEYFDSSKVDHTEELQKLGGAKVIMMCATSSDPAMLLRGLAMDGTLLVLGAGPTETPISLCTCLHLLPCGLPQLICS